jgi:RNA polymerase sigma factor (sigma-70 family)
MNLHDGERARERVWRVGMAVRPAKLNLVQAAQHGDESAFELLLEPLLEHGYRLACAMLHDNSAAEDAVQEAAFRAWLKVAQLRDPADMRPWFLTIVANQCRTLRRSRWWSVVRVDAPEPMAAPPDGAVLEALELRKALRAMDEGKRLILVLHWYLDLPLEEIAVVTGTSVHAAESRLLRATRELKRRMEAHRGRP